MERKPHERIDEVKYSGKIGDVMKKEKKNKML